jgi:hypothetical protein
VAGVVTINNTKFPDIVAKAATGFEIFKADLFALFGDVTTNLVMILTIESRFFPI